MLCGEGGRRGFIIACGDGESNIDHEKGGKPNMRLKGREVVGVLMFRITRKKERERRVRIVMALKRKKGEGAITTIKTIRDGSGKKRNRKSLHILPRA